MFILIVFLAFWLTFLDFILPCVPLLIKVLVVFSDFIVPKVRALALF
jgi:hypothetical protein